MINNPNNTENGETTHPMDFLLTEELNLPAVGEIRSGWVIERRSNEILIDIGAKSEGIIYGSEIQQLDEDALEKLSVGEEVLVYVVDMEDRHGNVVVSYSKAAAQQDWKIAVEYKKSQEVYQTKVIGQNRGGILVKVGHLRGFVPNSQLDNSYNNNEPKQVGQPINVKVLDVDENRNRLILSEKAARKEIREKRRRMLLNELEEGDVKMGRVINLANFGAFVDIGGIEGLVHLSELSWKRINHPQDVLSVGDEVEVSILNIDEEKKRLALSIKRLEPDPWTLIEEYYQEGQLLEATITKLTKYGAFARLHDEYELEGLIHISELSEQHVAHPSEIVEANQTVTVRIIRVDAEQRQLGLSIKQVGSSKFVEADLASISTTQE